MAAGLQGRVDFVLAFAVVHELPDIHRFFREASIAQKPGGKLLFSEPAGHVGEDDFAKSLLAAAEAGLRPVAAPAIASSRSALLVKG